ncbi:MFS transporter [Paenibacillus sp. FSL R7-0048]|jgi:PPP family 3-phenylpropionic acid transporter|uniref:MFS transporter n=1 Tax=Paenibacillus odorifer TaxID=189426 RepID=A0ABX3GVU5_9BACL|nr:MULTISPECIES: MFS transporter [Paenibacillus]MDH6426448.1 PPP family 3-phenylpropionic acid transporter [Paenibacillus sp. PastH-4]MDH6442472.1 PPP family 3-phenylpropionic acid transporter [Paenibacillus sp. PastF-4]MDH6526816.1 PPP family 3-phenylpropionic acid transporter [Paenibacillus sp. PastH-3]OMC78023.1 MFS transporter [Paenibacillus odorifer]OMD35900.1 MFS transporter [Paenibacillus odorifer]
MFSKRTGSLYSDQNWLRSFLFTIYGTSVLVVSYFPLFYTHLGFSSSQIGYLYSLGPLISILSNLFWSMISDKLGTVRKIMFILLAGQLVTGLLLARAAEFSSVMLILSFFYFFYYPVFPLADTMAIKVAERHGRNFITIRVFGSLGYSFFALTVGYALRALGSTWSLTLCIIIIIAALLITLGLKDVKRPAVIETTNQDKDTAEADNSKNGLKDILLQKEVLWFFGCVFVLALGHRMNEAFLTISLKQLGAGEEIIGWALLASALSEIPVLFILSRYGDKFKELPLLALGSLMYALRFLLMSLADHPGSMIAIQAMHSISFGVFYVTSVRYITRIIPDRLRATGLAIFTVVWSSASGLLSGTFGGIIYQEAGRYIFYIVATGFSLLAFAGFLGQHLLKSNLEPINYFRKKNKKASL